MQVEFLQAAKFGGHGHKDIPEEIFFSKGVHEVSDAVLSSAYFQMLLKAKLVIQPESPKPQPLSIGERNQMLAEKALAKPEAKVVAEDDGPSYEPKVEAKAGKKSKQKE